jgi:hypothetical protein
VQAPWIRSVSTTEDITPHPQKETRTYKNSRLHFVSGQNGCPVRIRIKNGYMLSVVISINSEPVDRKMKIQDIKMKIEVDIIILISLRSENKAECARTNVKVSNR